MNELLNPADAARFATYVDPETHLWQGYTDTDGYGIFTVTMPDGRRKKLRAHRVAWTLTHQQVPTGIIRHLCDTPGCCNPAHLVDGTQAENVADRLTIRRRSQLAALAAERVGQRTFDFDDQPPRA
jgi:HNH endonuclease